MKIRLSIKQNLLVEVTLNEDLVMKSAGIQSYTTMVGFIKDGKIFEDGKFSRTTTKHMNEIVYITGFPKQDSGQRKHFWEYPYGTRIRHDDSLSSFSSQTILKELAAGKSFFEAVSEIEKMTRRDNQIIEDILEAKGLKEALVHYRKIKNSFALI
jgi:hypothetical protein